MNRRATQPKRACLECGEVKSIEGRGLCNKCWQRLRYHGQLSKYEKPRKSPGEWDALADKTDPAGCWIWPGPKNPRSGYGWTGTQTAHVWAYEKYIGPIPQGSHVDHVCHSQSSSCAGGDSCPHRPCFNPAHLEAVSPAVNNQRVHSRRTHCPKGHEYTSDNMIGERYICRECTRARKRAAYWKDAEASRRQARERHARRRPEQSYGDK